MKKDYDFEEYCPYCEHINEIVWDGKSRTAVCENCHQAILLCSICEVENCGNCPYEKELGL
jgi:hypothetical protein